MYLFHVGLFCSRRVGCFLYREGRPIPCRHVLFRYCRQFQFRDDGPCLFLRGKAFSHSGRVRRAGELGPFSGGPSGGWTRMGQGGWTFFFWGGGGNPSTRPFREGGSGGWATHGRGGRGWAVGREGGPHTRGRGWDGPGGWALSMGREGGPSQWMGPPSGPLGWAPFRVGPEGGPLFLWWALRVGPFSCGP